MEVSSQNTVNLLEKLKAIPDVRRRQARLYPLNSVLAMLILAALNGQTSLRGMLVWAKAHWREIARPLGFKLGTDTPVYGTVWRILQLTSVDELEKVLGAWITVAEAEERETWSVDGKHLRGSKRRESELSALEVVTAAAQGIGMVLGQEVVKNQDEIAAVIALLERLPIEGKVVTGDAGMLTREVAQTILEKGGPI